MDSPGLVASLYYRERCARHVDLGIELQFTRRAFHVRYASGGLAGTIGAEVDAQIDLLHINITPEIRMEPTGVGVFRFGPQIGILVGGSMTGRSWNGVPYQWSQAEYDDASPSLFNGDLRFMVGFGIRPGGSSPISVSIDPYASVSVTSFLNAQPGGRCMEGGLKLGLALRQEKCALTQWVDCKTPMPSAEPNW